MWFVFIAFDRLIKNLGEWKLGVHFRKIGSGTNRKLFRHEFVRRICNNGFSPHISLRCQMNNNATQKVLYMFLLWHYIWEAIFFSGGGWRVNELRSGWLKLALRASLSSTFMCQKRKRCQTWSKKLKKFLARTKEKITHKTEPNWTVCHYVHKANVSPKPKCVSKLILNDLKYKHIYFLLFVCSSLGFFFR